MARATRFPVDAFERGRLPHVCILSGESTDDRMHLSVSNRPAVGWLLLFGILPYVIVKSMVTKSAQGSLPMTEEVYAAVKAAHRAPVRFYVAGLVIGVVGLAVSLRFPAGLALILAGIAIVIGGRLYGFSVDPLRGLRLDGPGRWVEVPNAADRFADAVADQLKAGSL